MRQLLFDITGHEERTCLFYEEKIESDQQLLVECHFDRALAFANCWGPRLKMFAEKVHRVRDIQSLVMLILKPPSNVINRIIDKALFANILTCLFFTIWSYRNGKLFQGKKLFHQAVHYFRKVCCSFQISFENKYKSYCVY